jgi:hypothetical protein
MAKVIKSVVFERFVVRLAESYEKMGDSPEEAHQHAEETGKIYRRAIYEMERRFADTGVISGL